MRPDSNPRMGIRFLGASCFTLIIGLTAHSAGADGPPGQDSLDLETALRLTRERNPGLAALRLEIEAREALREQAAKRPNPEITLDAENFAGSGSFAGADAMETTVGFSQVLETGGKRAARIVAARADAESARWDLRAEEARLAAQVRSAFAGVLAAQERLRILETGQDVHARILETAKLRHQAGKAPATEEMKARMAYSLAHIEIDRAAQEMRAALIRLGSFWTAEAPSFAAVRGDLRMVRPLPALDSLLPLLDRHPGLERWKTEEARRQAALRAAKAEGRPDATFAGGVRHLNDRGSGEVALVAGVSLPIPLLNRNRGAIREAEQRIAKAGMERRAARAELASRLRTLHQHLLSRGEELAHLKDELLPEADKTLQASQEAYRLGKLSFLDVLDSQRTLNDLASRYISSLAEYQSDWHEIQSLTSLGGMPDR